MFKTPDKKPKIPARFCAVGVHDSTHRYMYPAMTPNPQHPYSFSHSHNLVADYNAARSVATDPKLKQYAYITVLGSLIKCDEVAKLIEEGKIKDCMQCKHKFLCLLEHPTGNYVFEQQ